MADDSQHSLLKGLVINSFAPPSNEKEVLKSAAVAIFGLDILGENSIVPYDGLEPSPLLGNGKCKEIAACQNIIEGLKENVRAKHNGTERELEDFARKNLVKYAKHIISSQLVEYLKAAIDEGLLRVEASNPGIGRGSHTIYNFVFRGKMDDLHNCLEDLMIYNGRSKDFEHTRNLESGISTAQIKGIGVSELQRSFLRLVKATRNLGGGIEIE